MLRVLPLIFLLVPLAQAQVPDTIPPERYVPLAVGNEWHYEDWRSQGKPDWPPPPAQHVGYVVHDVIDEHEIDGEHCLEVRIRRFNLSGGQYFSSTGLVRYDGEVENLVSCTEGDWIEFYYASPCPLSAPFDSYVECPASGFGGADVWGWNGTVEIGSESVEATIKTFIPFAMESTHTVASDIGFTSFTFWHDSLQLIYARIGDEAYGDPYPISTQPTASTVGTLSLFPNPATTEVTVGFGLVEPQSVRIEVFDLLGRRVLDRDLGTLVAGEHEVAMNVANLPAGQYFLRLIGDAGAGAAVQLTRLR